MHDRHLNNDNLWGAWYSGLQTVTFMPPQNPLSVCTVSSPLKTADVQKYPRRPDNGCENSILETDSQTDGSTTELMRQQQRVMLPGDGENNNYSRTSKMRGARPKSTHYQQANHLLSNSSTSTPFRSSTAASGILASNSPSRKRGKSCDRLDSGSITSSDTQTRSRQQRLPKTIAAQHELLWNEISMSFDSTCTEETTSSSGGGADSHNYYHSGHRVLTTRQTQFHGKRQPHDINIFDKFLEEKVDSDIYNGPNKDIESDEKFTIPTFPEP